MAQGSEHKNNRVPHTQSRRRRTKCGSDKSGAIAPIRSFCLSLCPELCALHLVSLYAVLHVRWKKTRTLRRNLSLQATRRSRSSVGRVDRTHRPIHVEAQKPALPV